MSSDTLQERIAKAICEAQGRSWGASDGATHDRWRVIALAVMKAMREPTPPMSFAADDAVIEQYGENPEWEEAKDMAEGLIPTRIWTAMLDAEIAAAEEPSHDR